MAIVRIPTALRKYTKNLEEVTAAGRNIGEVLAELERGYPGIRERICDEKGAVRRFVKVFVRDEDIQFLQNLDTPVGDRDEVSIIPAIAGGSASLR